MDTPSRPSLRDWIIARRAAGLPVVSPNPRIRRPPSGLPPVDDEGGIAARRPQSSTDRLSIDDVRFPLNVRGAGGVENGGKPPMQSTTDRLSIAGRSAERSALNIRTGEAVENGGKPPSGSSIDRLSIADGIAVVEAAHEDRLDTWFAALADPTRRAMLAMLARGEHSVGALAAPHAMSLAAAARHVAVLDRAGLIARRRIGRRHLCRLRPAALTEVAAWLDRFAATGRDACRRAPTRYTAAMGQGRGDA